MENKIIYFEEEVIFVQNYGIIYNFFNYKIYKWYKNILPNINK